MKHNIKQDAAQRARMDWPKRVTLFIAWPVIAATFLALVLLFLIVGWALLLTPFVNLEGSDASADGGPGREPKP